jgi:hypothetical protein
MVFPRYGIKMTIDGSENGNYEITINWDGKSGASSRRPWDGFGGISWNSKKEIPDGTTGLEGEEDGEGDDN